MPPVLWLVDLGFLLFLILYYFMSLFTYLCCWEEYIQIMMCMWRSGGRSPFLRADWGIELRPDIRLGSKPPNPLSQPQGPEVPS